MRRRLSVARLSGFVLAAFLASGAALAQTPSVPQVPGTPPVKPAQPPAKLPQPQRGDRAKNLDFLFGALKAAPDEETAKAIEQRIWALLFVSGSDTADLLMARVRAAAESKDEELAMKLLDAIVEIKPDFAEAWNRRATLHFAERKLFAAIEDLRQVLAREPRHFGALTALALIFQEIGDDKRALEIYRKAIEINPHLERVPDLIKTLSEKVEGRDI